MATVKSLDGQKVKEPQDFQIQRFNLTKAGRTASGKMVMDLIAKKRKFEFDYEILKGSDLKLLMDIIDNADKLFYKIEYYDDDGTLKSATVYTGDIQYKKFRSGNGNGWYWKDVSFALIEQ